MTEHPHRDTQYSGLNKVEVFLSPPRIWGQFGGPAVWGTQPPLSCCSTIPRVLHSSPFAKGRFPLGWCKGEEEVESTVSYMTITLSLCPELSCVLCQKKIKKAGKACFYQGQSWAQLKLGGSLQEKTDTTVSMIMTNSEPCPWTAQVQRQSHREQCTVKEAPASPYSRKFVTGYRH